MKLWFINNSVSHVKRNGSTYHIPWPNVINMMLGYLNLTRLGSNCLENITQKKLGFIQMLLNSKTTARVLNIARVMFDRVYN